MIILTCAKNICTVIMQILQKRLKSIHLFKNCLTKGQKMHFKCILSILVFTTIHIAALREASAIGTFNFKDIRVVGHHFTTSFSNNKARISVKNPLQARYLVLHLSVNISSDNTKVFVDDFILSYFQQDGNESRSKCVALCRSKTADLGDFEGCSIGQGGWVIFDKATKYFSLVFFLENDVETIEIHGIGLAPIRYKVGTNRLYSVYIITNQGSPTLSKTEKCIQPGNYHIITSTNSTKLAPDTKGSVIHYAEGAEVQAREISQRLISGMGISASLEIMNLVSSFDVVVLIGK